MDWLPSCRCRRAGGSGRLVEEASIGAAAGDESQLLGEVTSIAVGGGRIHLVDLQATKVRVYDMSGAPTGTSG